MSPASVSQRAPGHLSSEDHGAAPPTAIMVEHLARRFGTRIALADVSFTVLQGAALGITGANGAGKTVLLRMLASLDRPTAGRAMVLGADTVQNATAVRRKVGYVAEEPRLYEGITVEQFLDFVGRARGLGTQVRAASVETLLQVVGMEGDRQRDVGVLSPGEKRRLMLASALLHEPEVLLLDDPLRGLDGQARLEQLEVLRELRRLDTTLLVSATRPEDLLDLCDEIAILRDGRVAWQGDAQAAAALASTVAADAVRVRAEILSGLEQVLALLSPRRDVRELEVDDDGRTVWFLFAGDLPARAALLPQFLRAGADVTHFGIERRSPANALAGLFRTGGG